MVPHSECSWVVPLQHQAFLKNCSIFFRSKSSGRPCTSVRHFLVVLCWKCKSTRDLVTRQMGTYGRCCWSSSSFHRRFLRTKCRRKHRAHHRRQRGAARRCCPGYLNRFLTRTRQVVCLCATKLLTFI